MPAARLTPEQLSAAHSILKLVRDQLDKAASGDPLVLFAMRRKVQKELMHDERGKPAHRIAIKKQKRAEQNNRCPLCGDELPAKNAVLDRFDAVLGYTVENTRLIHQHCDHAVQEARSYS
jgi:hypothetical protein